MLPSASSQLRQRWRAGLALALAGVLCMTARADDLGDRSAVIKPTAHELAWLQIPWMLDLKEAQRTAKEESRPMFLWATGDDPLERC